MYRVTNLTDAEIRKIGDAYADYTYSEGEVGMKTVRTRKIADNSFMYDLVWESEESAGTAEGGVGMYETYE